MPTWPNFMPEPKLAEITIGAPIGAVLRTDMDAGPAKQRRRFTAAPRAVSLSFEPVSGFYVTQFEAFFSNDLAMGALAFDMPHPITDLVNRFRFVAGDEPWQITPIGRDAYRITTSMELLP